MFFLYQHLSQLGGDEGIFDYLCLILSKRSIHLKLDLKICFILHETSHSLYS